jgi:hypothetical protein
MKSQWIIGGIVALVLGLLVTYIARNTYWDEISIPSPLRGEAVTNPFYASQHLAEALGARTEWRQTLRTLPNTKAVLVLSNWHWDLIETRRRRLEQWVEAGGHVVIDRSLIGDENDFARWSGIRREYPDDEEDDSEHTGEEAVEEEADNIEEEVGAPRTRDGVCGLIHAVDSSGSTGTNGESLSLCTLDGYSFLSTDAEIEWGYADDELQAVRVRVGRGSVTAVNATPFGNRDLAEEDHGKLFVGATQLHRGDLIIFLSEHEHTSLLGLMWLHGAPVVVLALIVLAALLWRGSVRFGPLAAATDAARRSLAEQIRGTGQFTVRLGGGKALHAAAVRALHEAARRRIPRYESMAHVERVAAMAQRAGIESEALAAAINHTGARRPSDLAHTVALLETARRKIFE